MAVGTGRIGGILLASGGSRRFGEHNKLLMPVQGSPLVVRTLGAYLGVGLTPVVVVVGYQGDLVADSLTPLPVEIVRNPDWERGQSRSLVRGVESLPDDVEAALIGVADQPLLTSDVVRALIERYRATGAEIVVPRYAGQRGNPVLFTRSLFPELLEVQGDRGGRLVVEAHADAAEWLDISDRRAGLDIDSIADYRSVQNETGE